jgi:hypothetical protein
MFGDGHMEIRWIFIELRELVVNPCDIGPASPDGKVHDGGRYRR